jgi:cell pole-organizing protein PopZ
MAQPNVAREPSMEEILASIRRIIESNEPTAENALSRPLPQTYGDDELEGSEDEGFAPDVAANDRGMPSRSGLPADVPASISQPERTLSLADVAARVRAASSRQPEPAPARVAPISEAGGAPAQQARQGEAPLRPLTPRMPEFREPRPEPAPAAQAAPTPVQPAPVPTQPEPVQRVMPVFDPPQPAPTRLDAADQQAPKPAPQSLPAKIEETANLLSLEAGAQVAKSFGELAAVFNGIERRSLEDMAGDMLRPMLQEWLDDNLPTLVERLVREEIERVARGPRR